MLITPSKDIYELLVLKATQGSYVAYTNTEQVRLRLPAIDPFWYLLRFCGETTMPYAGTMAFYRDVPSSQSRAARAHVLTYSECRKMRVCSPHPTPHGGTSLPAANFARGCAATVLPRNMRPRRGSSYQQL